MGQTRRCSLCRGPSRREVLLAGGLLGLIGCESMRPAAPPNLGGGERAQVASSVPKKPGGLLPPLRISKFVFYADVPLDGNDPLFKDLETLPDQIQRELRLATGNNIIQVFLFDDQGRYETFMKDRYEWLPVRRAYFISEQKRMGSAGDLQVFTWLGEHLRTDLRHELTHALLHEVLKGVPMWLDEGLAGYFEQPASQNGLNTEHLQRLRKEPPKFDLARLEKITKVSEMEKAEYREAWAWVHFLLHSSPTSKQVLLGYLQEHRTNSNIGPLLPRLKAVIPEPQEALAIYLQRLEWPAPIARGKAPTP
jgi:hypothetical protein